MTTTVKKRASYKGYTASMLRFKTHGHHHLLLYPPYSVLSERRKAGEMTKRGAPPRTLRRVFGRKYLPLVMIVFPHSLAPNGCVPRLAHRLRFAADITLSIVEESDHTGRVA